MVRCLFIHSIVSPSPTACCLPGWQEAGVVAVGSSLGSGLGFGQDSDPSWDAPLPLCRNPSVRDSACSNNTTSARSLRSSYGPNGSLPSKLCPRSFQVVCQALSYFFPSIVLFVFSSLPSFCLLSFCLTFLLLFFLPLFCLFLLTSLPSYLFLSFLSCSLTSYLFTVLTNFLSYFMTFLHFLLSFLLPYLPFFLP